MALTGLHVSAGYAGSATHRYASAKILGRQLWSQTLATAGTTANTAPASRDTEGDPIFQIAASVDAFVAIGPNPDATNGARIFVRANTDWTAYAQQGDRLSWVPA